MEHKHYKTATAIWLIFITIMSLVSFGDNTLPKIKFADKIVHFSFHFVLTLLLLKAFETQKIKKYALIICFILSYGIIIEVLQECFTSDRKAELLDVLANSTGMFTAFFIYKYILKKI